MTMAHRMLSPLPPTTTWDATVALTNFPQTAFDLTALKSEGLAGHEVATADQTAEPPTAVCGARRSGENFLVYGCSATWGTSSSGAADWRREVIRPVRPRLAEVLNVRLPNGKSFLDTYPTLTPFRRTF